MPSKNRKSDDPGRLPRMLADLLRACVASPDTTGDLAAHLDQLSRQLPIVTKKSRQPESRPKSPPKLKFVVEGGRGQQTLAEYRIGGSSEPFRVPYAIYQAVAAALAADERPLGFDELMDSVAKRMSGRPGDHQVRATLRFWRSLAPPLIQRLRSRYHPTPKDSFLLAVQRAWDRAAG